MKKRWISLLLVFVMVTALVPQMATEARAVQSGTCGDNLTWVLDDEGTLTISGTGEMYDYKFNNDFTGFDTPWFSLSGSIKTVKFESGVAAVGDHFL